MEENKQQILKEKTIDLKNRWASCSGKGNINFHWKCILVLLDVLSYIIVHELVHIIHKAHTTQFWNEIDKVVPNYQKHVDWLKRYEAGMDL